jgi:hypothetical protein
MPKMRIALALLLLAAGPMSQAADRPRDLQAEMVRVENEYFTLYNQLNTDHQYDMVCRKERPTGSSFDVRICQPQYVLTAKEATASNRMQSAVSAGQSAGPANSAGPDVGNTVPGVAGQLNKDDAFRKNMLDVLQKSPELQALGKKRDELQARYDAATKGTGGH